MDVLNNSYMVAAQQGVSGTVAGEMKDTGVPVFTEGDEIIDAGDEFSFDDFQVVRREFFAHLREPAVTFNQ